MEVYFYVDAIAADSVLECGLKLSRWGTRDIVGLNGLEKKYIAGLINPKDDMDKYKDKKYKCLKIEVQSHECYMGDRYLYNAGVQNKAIMDIYVKTLLKADKYVIGMFRIPECLIGYTVLCEKISLLRKGMGTTLLYNSSEEVYINNLFETGKEQEENFLDIALYYYFLDMTKRGNMEVVLEESINTAVFTDKFSGKVYVTKIHSEDSLT